MKANILLILDTGCRYRDARGRLVRGARPFVLDGKGGLWDPGTEPAVLVIPRVALGAGLARNSLGDYFDPSCWHN